MTAGDHHFAQRIDTEKLLPVDFQKTVPVCKDLYFTLFDLGTFHPLTLAKVKKDLRRFIFMEHVLIFFPYIEVILTHGKQYRNIFFCHDMTFPEDRSLGLVFYDLCHVMAEYVSHGVDGFYFFHDSLLLSKFCPFYAGECLFFIQYIVFSGKNPVFSLHTKRHF